MNQVRSAKSTCSHRALAEANGFVEGYNAAIEDVRRLIGPSGLGDRYFPPVRPALDPQQPGRHQGRRERSSTARARAEALFKGGSDGN